MFDLNFVAKVAITVSLAVVNFAVLHWAGSRTVELLEERGILR
jgi:hypothetical protein